MCVRVRVCVRVHVRVEPKTGCRGVDTFAFGLPWEQRPLPASPSRCEVPVSGLTDKPHLHAHYPVTVSPKFTLESCTWGAGGIRRQGLWEVTRS